MIWTRIILISVALVIIVVNVSYGAFLVSVLTTAKPSLPFRTFEDLRNLEDWKVSVHTNSVFSRTLKNAKQGSAMREVWDNKVVKYWEETLIRTCKVLNSLKR
ncbi:hypothetical protein Avbf_18613, partial [Armadillidium vulgare]